LSGSAFRTVVPTEANSFRLLSGTPKVYVKTGDSGNKREQTFCGDCGSPIYSGGQVTQFNTSTGGARCSLAAVAVSSPKEVAFAAWADDTQSGGDTTGRPVRGRPLKVPAAGF
jgi:hypothetical protein